MTDPHRTAALRAAVLDAWARSPTRFREDANAEEDLRLGGYAGAWFVELAQNAADAAVADGRMRVEVVDGELRVANTGAPLTAAGVTALASLRASAKRDEAGSVGRFGVGFAAVLTVSDAPRVVSTSGSVAFSAPRTAAAVADLPGPAAELARRDGPPALRLVWASDEVPPPGWATEVRLPLRADADAAALLAHARALAPDLLLALPGLVEIDIAGHAVRRIERPGGVEVEGRRWRLARRSGELATGDVAAEQRDRRAWTVTWALPLDVPLGEDVAHAPTATTEALSFPARLIATLPLEPDRRRVRPGRATDALVAEAARAYVDLVLATPGPERLALVPEPGFPRSALDGQLREALLRALRTTSWLPTPDPRVAGSEPLSCAVPTREPGQDPRVADPGPPSRAVPTAGPPSDPRVASIEPASRRVPGGKAAGRARQVADPDGEGVRLLEPGRAEWLDLAGVGDRLPALLVHAGFDRLAAPPYHPTLLAELGAARLAPATAVERLFGVEQPVAWWHAVYDELAAAADTVPGLFDDLRALPVLLADGRAALGPSTVLLPGADPLPALPGLPVAALAHPLLARLGAGEAEPAALLAHPALVDAVERSVDDADAGLDTAPLAEAVLALAQRTRVALPALALPVEGGGVARADELMFVDAALRPVLVADAPLDVLDPAWAARFPRTVLTEIGVVDGFALVLDEEPAGPDHDLDDEDAWWDSLEEPPPRLVAVRDLDLVDDHAWPAALALLAADRDTRDAAIAGYTAWWLARHSRFGGRSPGHWRLPSATAIAALYDPVPLDGSPSATDWSGTDGTRVGVGAERATHWSGTGDSRIPGRADDALLAAIGVRTDLRIADATDADDLLARLADPHRTPDAALVAEAHIALADAVADGRVDAADLVLPEHVRALDGSIVHVDVAAVLDTPWPAAVLPPGELVIGGDPIALAELLDLPLATEIAVGAAEEPGTPVAWSAVGEVVVACHTLGVAVPDGSLRRHDELWVRLTRPDQDRHRVPAWRDPDGTWHASDPLRALVSLLSCYTGS